MKKILTVTLNPAIDVRYNVENMRIGEVNRTKHIEKTAGGKGINWQKKPIWWMPASK